MINQNILLFTLLTLAQFAIAQNHPYTVKFSHEIESDLATGKLRPSKAGILYSLIGDYNNSILFSDIPISWGVDSLALERYSAQDALPLIIDEAKEQQIVIISENHLRPQHRIFADKIITELARIGFEHLGLETFASLANNNTLLDSALIHRGYPLNSPLTGTYTLEPQMGKLVRNAINSELVLFAYERSLKIDGMDRDEIQADNIIKYLKSNPNSKIIILCGFHHAVESDIIKRGNKNWMAKYLKDKTGIDPMTIYQDNFTEKQIENEHPILNSLDLSEPSLFVDAAGKVVRLSEHVDYEVIHPKTTYINSRPSWLYHDENSKPVKIETESTGLDFPIIVEAYPSNEVNSVPVDRIELKHKYDNKVLVLRAGEYRIELNDGENVYEYSHTVK